jgi:hypothetical protein
MVDTGYFPDGGTGDSGANYDGGFRPCTAKDAATKVKGGCIGGCAVGALCCTGSGGCKDPAQDLVTWCNYSGNYPDGCKADPVNGGCATDSICVHTLPPSGDHVITVINLTGADIWVAAFASGVDPSTYKPVGDWNPMWLVKNCDAKRFTIPFAWSAGRIWARTGCVESGGTLTCDTGDCKGAYNCAVSGTPPATLAEFTMMGGNGTGVDWYDISMVDGFNTLVRIKPQVLPSETNAANLFCDEVACTTTPMCWQEGLYKSGAGCLSPCLVSKYTDPRHCCKCDMTTTCACENGIPSKGGTCCAHDTAPLTYGCSPFYPANDPHPTDSLCDWNGQNGRPGAAWDPTPQNYVKYVSNTCPQAYAWQFHDLTSLHSCVINSGPVNYEVTFLKADIKGDGKTP